MQTPNFSRPLNREIPEPQGPPPSYESVLRHQNSVRKAEDWVMSHFDQSSAKQAPHAAAPSSSPQPTTAIVSTMEPPRTSSLRNSSRYLAERGLPPKKERPESTETREHQLSVQCSSLQSSHRNAVATFGLYSLQARCIEEMVKSTLGGLRESTSSDDDHFVAELEIHLQNMNIEGDSG
ncbi:MAG: hypothetical protein M1828_004595 [Chrysothrix sp. TS-e1954]|nr:MAG: hypothetical protein M1828_004595 [Chrysothrix sp. TS-e1954]